MAKCNDEEVGYSSSREFDLNIGDRLPPPGGEDVPALLSKMQLNPGSGVDSRKEALKSTVMIKVVKFVSVYTLLVCVT